MFPRLDELALRAEGFQEGVPVTLWDGQAWHFPKPVVLGAYPVPDAEGGGFAFKALYDFGQEYGKLMDAYIENSTYANLVSLAWTLLRLNYRLEPADLGGLLFRPREDDPRRAESDAMYEAIWQVASGQAPKPTPVGSSSASDSTG